jgi:hypothetical protein
MNYELKQFLYKANTRGYCSAEINEERLPNGDLDDFSANEKIMKDGREVYSAKFFGGLVDVRREF